MASSINKLYVYKYNDTSIFSETKRTSGKNDKTIECGIRYDISIRGLIGTSMLIKRIEKSTTHYTLVDDRECILKSTDIRDVYDKHIAVERCVK